MHRYISVLGKLPHRSEIAELDGFRAGVEAELYALKDEKRMIAREYH